MTINGAISGTGGFTKIGSDTLTLGGTNTYQGTTVINGGTLIGTDGQTSFGTGSANYIGAVTINNGTLQLNPTAGTRIPPLAC